MVVRVTTGILFVVSIGFTRELHLEASASPGGAELPQPREGNGTWTPYVGPTPVTGDAAHDRLGGGRRRSVVDGHELGGRLVLGESDGGPYAWVGGPDDCSPGLILALAEGVMLVTPTAPAACVICNLANAGATHGGLSNPGPLWQLLPIPGDDNGPHAAIGVGGVGIVVGERNAVGHLYLPFRTSGDGYLVFCGHGRVWPARV